eukprot:COSAG01_NODE_710_length_14110_cov_94.506745_12_plen_177_part_00
MAGALLLQANPLSSLMLLLRNGPGLMGLALARVLWLASIHCNSLVGLLQLSVLHWTPQDQANFGQLITLPRMVLQRCFTMPFMRLRGMSDVWRTSTVGAALGYALVGQTFRRLLPLRFGAQTVSMKTLTALQFGLVQLFLIDAFVGATGISLQSMFLKHASSCVVKADGQVFCTQR